MKRSEAIVKYYDAIRAEMIDLYRTVIECDGRIQYKLYVWEDGEIERLEGPQGDNAWLRPRDMEPRELYYVDTIEVSPSFSVWDSYDEVPPEDEAERENLVNEIVDWLCDSYKETIDEHLDAIIEEAEYEEQFD